MFELKFNLKGTINRKEFLLSMILSIINFIVCLAISMIDLFIHFGGDYKPGTTPSLSFWGGISLFITTVMILITLWYFLAQCMKRLRDISLSGLWLLVLVVPIANIFLLVYLLFAKSTDNTPKDIFA